MIIVRTPLRISLAGGGTDIPEYFLKNGYGAVCSLAINKYVYVCVKELPEEFPFRYKLSYSKTELVNSKAEIEHPIIRWATSLAPGNLSSLDFNSMADIPAGTGMGSSSSFTVGLLHALWLHQGQTPSKEELARLACRVEIDLCGEPIGKQDQYAAAYGGINYFRFNADGSVLTQPVILDPAREKEMLSTLRLFYLGKQERSASAILAGQAKSGHALKQLRDCADAAVYQLTQGSPKGLGQLLDASWQNKKTLSSSISNDLIDRLYDLALRQGAWGGKLLGAGGSGFLLISCPPDCKLDLGLKEIPFRVDYQGSKAYYMGE